MLDKITSMPMEINQQDALEAMEGSNDVNQRISHLETLIGKKVDTLVILQYDGKALTKVGIKAMDAGIPVINLDRVFASPRGARAWIGGDNYGMGAAAGQYIVEQLKAKGVLKCTLTYSPSMASSAIKLARLVAQNKGMSDLAEKEIPASITLASATVTKENVDMYLPLGFAS